MYPRCSLCEEAKIKQHTSLKNKLRKIGQEAIWEFRFTCSLIFKLSLKKFYNSISRVT